MPAGGPATLLRQRLRLRLYSLSAQGPTALLPAVTLSFPAHHLAICICFRCPRGSEPPPGCSLVSSSAACARGRHRQGGMHVEAAALLVERYLGNGAPLRSEANIVSAEGALRRGLAREHLLRRVSSELCRPGTSPADAVRGCSGYFFSGDLTGNLAAAVNAT